MSACVYEPKVISFLPKSKFVIKNSGRKLNSISDPGKKYSSGSAFLVSLTAPNKQTFNLKIVFKS